MTWEIVRKNSERRAPTTTAHCVVNEKIKGVRFNQAALALMGVEFGGHVAIYMDKQRKKIGFTHSDDKAKGTYVSNSGCVFSTPVWRYIRHVLQPKGEIVLAVVKRGDKCVIDLAAKTKE